jgi:hypothetical protein
MRLSISKIALAAALTAAPMMFGQTSGQDMKQAGRDVKDAAKNTGKATAHATRTTGRKIKHKTHKAATKVEEKTR